MSTCLPFPSPLSQLLHILCLDSCCRGRNSDSDDDSDTTTTTPRTRTSTADGSCADPHCDCEVTTWYDDKEKDAGFVRTADAMHIPQQHPAGFVSVATAHALHLTPPGTPTEVEALSRTVSVPTAPGTEGNGSFGEEALILAWALLLQRERGEEAPVDQFPWGWRTSDGEETTERFSLAAAGLELSRAKTETISTALEGLQASTKSLVPEHPESLFFNDEPQGLVSQKEGQHPTVSSCSLTFTPEP